jgi:hypothetical protein
MKIIFMITKPISGIREMTFGIGKMTSGMTHARPIVPLVMMRGDFPGPRCTGDARPGGEGQFWERPRTNAAAAEPKAKPPRPKKEKVKIKPQLVAKARELRDRYLEQVNERLLLASSGKYDMSRALTRAMPATLPLLPAA